MIRPPKAQTETISDVHPLGGAPNKRTFIVKYKLIKIDKDKTINPKKKILTRGLLLNDAMEFTSKESLDRKE